FTCNEYRWLRLKKYALCRRRMSPVVMLAGRANAGQAGRAALPDCRGPVQDAARPRRGHFAVLEGDLAVDDHLCDADRVLVRLLERCLVADGGRIEDGDVGLKPFAKDAAVGEADALRRKGRHLVD